MNSCYQPNKAAASGKNIRKWIIPLAGIALLAVFITNLLFDVEFDDQDVTTKGLGIFLWSKPSTTTASTEDARAPLFANGVQSVDPNVIRQGTLCDCNFLATVASFINQPSGRRKLVDMIKTEADGGYTVTFPGAVVEPVKVAALSPVELSLYAHARSKDGTTAGLWLPVLEKAYGEYRIAHQDLGAHAWRCLKHGIFEARWTSTPMYPGLGASFGSKDNIAASLLTGHPVTELATADFELGEFGLGKRYATSRQVMSWFRRAKVLDMFLNEQHGSLLDVSAGKALATATTEQSTNCEQVGLRNRHAYSVTGYDCVKKQIYLYDPYGNTDYDSNTGTVVKRSGHFILTLQEFNKYFSHLNVERTNPKVTVASI